MLNSDCFEWLEHQCSKLMYGKCTTLSCMKRGGYKPEDSHHNYEKSTCEVYEIYQELQKNT